MASADLRARVDTALAKWGDFHASAAFHHKHRNAQFDALINRSLSEATQLIGWWVGIPFKEADERKTRWTWGFEEAGEKGEEGEEGEEGKDDGALASSL